ncbi:MAG: polyamine aminopropyltransferase [Chloroflexota bacterium]
MNSANWVIESRGSGEIHGHALRRHILSTHSEFQEIQIVETCRYGVALILDGVPQSSEVDEFIYHEALIHPALCSHPNPRSVLIIGGAEGADLREVLKHPGIERVVMVDIDGELVRLCREHLPTWHEGSFDDPRVELQIGDGRAYLEQNPGAFDCVFLDLSDPFEGSPARLLFTAEFYGLAQRALRDSDGVVALQSTGAALGSSKSHSRIVRTLRHVFPSVFPYYAYIPLYATLYSFSLCGGEDLSIRPFRGSAVDQILERRGIRGLRFFDGETAAGMFGVPKHLRSEAESDDVSVVYDDRPLEVWGSL